VLEGRRTITMAGTARYHLRGEMKKAPFSKDQMGRLKFSGYVRQKKREVKSTYFTILGGTKNDDKERRKGDVEKNARQPKGVLREGKRCT